MNMADDIIEDAELAEAVNRLLGEIVSEQDVSVRRLVQGVDEYGDPMWVIVLRYLRSDTPIRPSDNARLIFEIREFLHSRNDTRFPHVYHNLPEGQPVATAC